MLVVTANAGQAIESIVANAEMPDGSGLRIDATGAPPATLDGSGPGAVLPLSQHRSRLACSTVELVPCR